MDVSFCPGVLKRFANTSALFLLHHHIQTSGEMGILRYTMLGLDEHASSQGGMQSLILSKAYIFNRELRKGTSTWQSGGQELWDIYCKFWFDLKVGSRHISHERTGGNILRQNNLINMHSRSVLSLVDLFRIWWCSIFLQPGNHPLWPDLGVIFPSVEVQFDSGGGDKDDQVWSLPAGSQFPLDPNTPTFC